MLRLSKDWEEGAGLGAVGRWEIQQCMSEIEISRLPKEREQKNMPPY